MANDLFLSLPEIELFMTLPHSGLWIEHFSPLCYHASTLLTHLTGFTFMTSKCSNHLPVTFAMLRFSVVHLLCVYICTQELYIFNSY